MGLKAEFGDPYKEYEEIAGFEKKPMMLSLKEIVLIAISRLLDKRDRFIGPTYEDVINYIESRYGKRYSRRSIEKVIEDLESEGHIYRMRKLLQDGRVVLLTTKEVERIAFSLIKLTEKEALVHNHIWEGKVYDPPTEDATSPSIPSWWWMLAGIMGTIPLIFTTIVIGVNEIGRLRNSN